MLDFFGQTTRMFNKHFSLLFLPIESFLYEDFFIDMIILLRTICLISKYFKSNKTHSMSSICRTVSDQCKLHVGAFYISHVLYSIAIEDLLACSRRRVACRMNIGEMIVKTRWRIGLLVDLYLNLLLFQSSKVIWYRFRSGRVAWYVAYSDSFFLFIRVNETPSRSLTTVER